MLVTFKVPAGSRRRLHGAGQGSAPYHGPVPASASISPGDVAGTGTVTNADITTIKKMHGDAATNSSYNFDADVNRDGVINSQDVKLAKQNLGASTQGQPGRLGEPRPGLEPGRIARRPTASSTSPGT